jgi:hypothetical protein
MDTGASSRRDLGRRHARRHQQRTQGRGRSIVHCLDPRRREQATAQHNEAVRNIVWIGMPFCDEITLRRDFCATKIIQIEFPADEFRWKYNAFEENMSDDSNAFVAQK